MYDRLLNKNINMLDDFILKEPDQLYSKNILKKIKTKKITLF